MIQITRTIRINESEIQEYFTHASGPGGQNVNKVSTAVQLRFDVNNSRSLSEEVRKRLITLAGNRITEDGILIIDARQYRTQRRNRDDAINRFVELIRHAVQKPKTRRKTQPTLTSKTRRLESKRSRAETKQSRRAMPESADG